jgi:galactokinase
METQIRFDFINKYKNKPILVKAPGRINIIGEHTDYNMGYVLPAAIEQSIFIAVHSNLSNKINIETSLNEPDQIVFNLDGTHVPFDSFWGNYFKAIIEILNDEDFPLVGFDCVFGGDIPIGAGLSSSAALCCGFIHAVAEVCGLTIPKESIAKIAQKAEHKIGLNCGLMDQFAVLFGKKENAIFLDCSNLSFEYVPIDLKDYSWVLINSNIKHNLAIDSEYNKRRASCETIVKTIKQFKDHVTSLRDITAEDLESIKSKVSPTDLQRGTYVLNENARVLRMMKALRDGDAAEVGKILLQGHWAMSKQYEITTPELDLLVRTAEKLDGILGSRMMGGGFGGCTINLMKSDNMNQNITSILATYKAKTGIDGEFHHVSIDDGVRTLISK